MDDDLRQFAELSSQYLLSNDFDDLVRNLQCALEQCEDYAIAASLGTFIDDLKAWLREVHEIREHWHWDNDALSWPDDCLRVFGYTSELVMKIEPLQNRAALMAKFLKPRTGTLDRRKVRALRSWNDGKSWPEVQEEIDGGDPESLKAFEQEIKRFATANNLKIRKGKQGRKRKE